MGDAPGPDISLGLCYSRPGSRSTDDYIPCGNAHNDIYQCCIAGDICMAENACADKTDQTYFYLGGCTDLYFESSKCPNKAGYDDQQYVPLVYCDDEYSGCFSEKDAPGDAGKDPSCDCDSNAVLFSTSTLRRVASLPAEAGGTVSPYVQKITSSSTKSEVISISTIPEVTDPTSEVLPNTLETTTSTTGSATDSTLSSSSSATPLPTTTTSPDGTPVISDSGSPSSLTTSGSSTSTTMYVGIGVGVGGAVVLGCLLFLVLFLRRRKRMRESDNDSDPMAYMGQPTIPVLPPTPPRNDEYPTGTALSGFKSELSAEAPNKAGTSMMTTSSDPNSPGSSLAHYPQSPQGRQFQAYNPLVHGNYAERRDSQGPVSPSSPGPQENNQRGNQGPTSAGPIHELA